MHKMYGTLPSTLRAGLVWDAMAANIEGKR